MKLCQHPSSLVQTNMMRFRKRHADPRLSAIVTRLGVSQRSRNGRWLKLFPDDDRRVRVVSVRLPTQRKNTSSLLEFDQNLFFFLQRNILPPICLTRYQEPRGLLVSVESQDDNQSSSTGTAGGRMICLAFMAET